MKFSKYTADRMFKITIESDQLSEDESVNEQIPHDSILGLVLELELVAAELRKLVDDAANNATFN